MIYFLLTANDLQVFTKKQQSQLVFPPEVIKFQEILDRKAFETLLKKYFGGIKGGEAILFLSEELLFEKALDTTQAENIEAEFRSFLGKIPFDSDFLAKKIVKSKKQTFLLAAYRDYFQTIVHIAQLYGWDIKHVVPLSLFSSVIMGKQMNYQLLSSLIRNKNVVEVSDMLLEFIPKEDAESQTPEEETRDIIEGDDLDGKQIPKFTMKSQYLVALVSLMCFGAAIYFAYPILFPSKSKTNVQPTPTVLPTRVPTPTSVATVSATLKKEDIHIEVLNGSGVAGQATVIKNALEDHGFSLIDTGNAPGEVVTISSVTFSATVSQAIQTEVLQLLKESLSSINTQQVATQDGYDMQIITGEPL
jgi:hypothetical protein